MSRATLEQAVSLLGSLSSAELEQLSAKVAALRVLSGPVASAPRGATGLAAGDLDAFTFLIYAALSAALEQEQQASPPFGVFIRTRPGAAFVRAAGEAGKLHERWFPLAPRSQTASLCRIYARSVLNYLEARNKPFKWPLIALALGSLAEVLSHSFPGYGRAGVMSMLEKQPLAPERS